MSKNARMMTHKASGLAIGGAESMRQTATLIESLEETIATIYANKSGLTQADAKAKFLKQEDNWMTAEQAMQEKLVDGIFDATASVDVPATAKTDKEVWKIYNTIFHTNNNNMKQIFLTAEQLGKINLKADTADATAFAIAFDNLVAEAAKVPQLTNELTAAKTAKKTAEDALENLKSSQDTATIENLIAGGVKDKKFTVEVGNQLKAAYAGNPTGLKSLVDAMPVYTGIVASIGVGVNADRIKELSAKTWDEMDKSGELTELKAIAFDVFKDKYKTTFKKDFE